MKSVKDILIEKAKANPKARFNRHEFQAYGNTLAEELNDQAHRSLYIKFAKTINRGILDSAREFIKGTGNLKSGSRARLFMWKLKELKEKAKLEGRQVLYPMQQTKKPKIQAKNTNQKQTKPNTKSQSKAKLDSIDTK